MTICAHVGLCACLGTCASVFQCMCMHRCVETEVSGKVCFSGSLSFKAGSLVGLEGSKQARLTISDPRDLLSLPMLGLHV